MRRRSESLPWFCYSDLLYIGKLLEEEEARSYVFCGGENLDMSSVCDKLDFKDAESHLVSSFASNPINCCNGSKGISFVGSQDAHESEGDDSGYINECVK